MILGIVILLVVGLVFYFVKSSGKKQAEASVTKVQDTFISIQPIKEFTTKCVDKLAKDAIVLLSRQGGYIYKSQGGTIVDYAQADNGIFFITSPDSAKEKIAFNIMPPKGNVANYFSNPPENPSYPWKFFPYDSLIGFTEKYEGYFGTDTMPPLTEEDGQNSMQSQIENFIDDNMDRCLDLSSFEEQDYIISKNKSRTRAVLGVYDVSVKSSIPIKITHRQSGESTELRDFSSTVPVRLATLYSFSDELIKNDIKNIKFDIKSPINNKDGFEIKVNPSTDIFDDIITVIDKRSQLYGRDVEYSFGRRNRAPALHLIRPDEIIVLIGTTIDKNKLLGGKELMAYDPDEDKIDFTITPSIPFDATESVDVKIEATDGKYKDYQIVKIIIPEI